MLKICQELHTYLLIYITQYPVRWVLLSHLIIIRKTKQKQKQNKTCQDHTTYVIVRFQQVFFPKLIPLRHCTVLILLSKYNK